MNTKREMIETLFSKRVNTSLRNIVAPRQNLTFEVLKSYYASEGFHINDSFLQNLELLTEDGKYNFNAYLFADSNGVSFRVTKYADKKGENLIQNEEYGYVSILRTVIRLLDRFVAENPTEARITYKRRIEWKWVEPVPLEEVIINALIHNDYSHSYTPIFKIYPDRFEIVSYGGLPLDLSKEEFFASVSKPRNKELTKVFRDLHFTEQNGITQILKYYGTNIFNIKPDLLTVTLPFKLYEDNFIFS